MYTEKSAILQILRGGGSVKEKKIYVKDCGIKTQGAADYLVKYCGYIRVALPQ